MKQLNKIRLGLQAVAMLLLFVSCEDWLSVSPRTEVKKDDLFAIKNGFKDQITGIYTALCKQELYGANLTLGGVDVLGQYYYMTWNGNPSIYADLARFKYESSGAKSVIDGIWLAGYNAIANINILLEALDEQNDLLKKEEAAVYKGEALGLRAFIHFDLLRLFGKSMITGADELAIPYVEEMSKQVTKQSSVREVLEKIVRDLQAAERLLENDPLITGGENVFLGTRNYHFNYYAVKAALARVFLWKGDKANALKYAQEVMDAGRYHWVPQEEITVSEMKKRNRIFDSEVIFSLNNTKLKDYGDQYLWEGGSSTTDQVMYMQGNRCKDIYEAVDYGSIDWRYVYLFMHESYYSYSYRLLQLDGMPDHYKNIQPILRLSEMYLIAAECETDKEKAIGYFNTFRQHRGFNTTNDLKVTISDSQFQSLIGKEYRKEFLNEGQWFFYCKRLDMAELPNSEVAFSKSYYCLPMPQTEIEYGGRK